MLLISTVIFRIYVPARSLPVYKSHYEYVVLYVYFPPAETIFINPGKIVCKSNNGGEKYFELKCRKL